MRAEAEAFFLQKVSLTMPVKAEAAIKTMPGARGVPPSTRDRLIEVGLDRMRRHGYGATGLQEILMPRPMCPRARSITTLAARKIHGRGTGSLFVP